MAVTNELNKRALTYLPEFDYFLIFSEEWIESLISCFHKVPAYSQSKEDWLTG